MEGEWRGCVSGVDGVGERAEDRGKLSVYAALRLYV
jgi:hypothetical protein